MKNSFPQYEDNLIYDIVFTKLENVLHSKNSTYTVVTNADIYYYKQPIK
jgi:hypothetical protein